MPSPTTIAEFTDLIRKSGVVEDSRLNDYLASLAAQSAMPAEPRQCAVMMIRDGVLTHFQAENLLAGRWKRFFIGKYKVLERLGHGGMAQVFLCEHKIMKRRVAVKVLPTARADEPSSLERFHREARVVAALDHVNIVRAFDVDQDDQLHFLVMEYVDGVNLQDLVRRHGPLDPLRASHYIRQAAIGLQHAFDTAGVLHRDIKPGNLLVDRQGTVKILDMGLARFFHDHEDLLTKQYDETVLGTADYLAPEQAVDSHTVDIRADIYSLGGTFYFLLTGQPPFPEGTVAQKLIWHQTRQPKPITDYRQDVPADLIAIIEKMMAKSLEERYRWPREVAEALEPFLTTPIPPPADHEIPQLCPAAQGVSITLSTRPTPASAPTEIPSSRTTPRPAVVRQQTVGSVVPKSGPAPKPSPAKPLPKPADKPSVPQPPTQTLRSPSAETAPVPVVPENNARSSERPREPRVDSPPARQPAGVPVRPAPTRRKSLRNWLGIVAMLVTIAVFSAILAAVSTYYWASP
jgi:serine/threonine protein kinase